MKKSEWITLNYDQKLNEVFEAIASEEPLDFVSDQDLLNFFEESPDVELERREFVDTEKLNNLIFNRDYDENAIDWGIESFLYADFRKRLTDEINSTLFENFESFELELLNSIGCAFVIKETYIIKKSFEGEIVNARFTKNTFSDGRECSFAYPWSSVDEHGFIDYDGFWLEVDGEATESESEFIAGLDNYSLDDYEDYDKKLDLELTALFADDFSFPDYNNEDDIDLTGLGDFI